MNKFIYVVKIIKRYVYRNKIVQLIKEYLSTLNLRFIHNRYKRIIKRLKNKLGSGKKINILFFVTQKQLWCVQSLYDELSNSLLFQPIVVAFPNGEDRTHPYSVTCEENYKFFSQINMVVGYGYNIEDATFSNVEDLKADIVFYDQPYPWLPKKLLFESVSKNALICYVPYGYKIANSYQAHFNMELQNKCWKVFAESNWHKHQFEKYGRMKGANVVVSGYPKLDVYRTKKESTCDACRGDKAPNKSKRIIWAPHWSIRDKFLGYSTFDKIYKSFLEYAKASLFIEWIFKPHQRLRYHCVESGFLTKTETDEYYDNWEGLSNAKLCNDPNYFNIFKTSDALITDCGSFLAEYLPTKNPILLLLNEGSVGYNEIGNKIISNYYKAKSFDDIINFIERVVIGGDDYLKDKRLEALEHVIVNKEGAGKYIVNFIEQELSEEIK